MSSSYQSLLHGQEEHSVQGKKVPDYGKEISLPDRFQGAQETGRGWMGNSAV